MKFLRKKGLINPRIVCQDVVHSKTKVAKRGFMLVCDNYTESKMLSKKYSFFEQLFEVFLLKEVEDIFKELKKIVIKEEGLSEKDNAGDIIISYLEEKYEDYLNSMKDVINTQLEERMKLPFDFRWVKAFSATMVQMEEDDIKNGILLFCLIPKKSEETIPVGSKMIETRAINALYKERFFDIKPNIHYFYIDDVSIEFKKLHTDIRLHLQNGEAVMYIVPTDKKNRGNSPKTVYLYKSLFARNKDKGGEKLK